MRILVTNDDGWRAPGLLALIEAARSLGSEVAVAVPLENQSGVAHRVTYKKPLLVSPAEFEGADRAFTVDGTPCDCVRLALGGLLPAPPDFVLSGVNHGANLGHDVSYSGTVAAAAEAATRGVPAVAVSRCMNTWSAERKWDDHDDIARFLVSHLREIIRAADALPAFSAATPATAPPANSRNGQAEPLLLNINLPDVAPHAYAGVRFTIHAGQHVGERYEPRQSPHGRLYFWPHREAAGWDDDHLPDGMSDHAAVRDGFVSVTPLAVNRTNRARLDDLRLRFEQLG